MPKATGPRKSAAEKAVTAAMAAYAKADEALAQAHKDFEASCEALPFALKVGGKPKDAGEAKQAKGHEALRVGLHTQNLRALRDIQTEVNAAIKNAVNAGAEV